MKEKTSIVFTGDIGFDRYMDGKWEDENLLSQEILSFLYEGDHVIANVEGPLVEQPTNKTTEGVVQLMHTMNPAAIKVLGKMKADVWNICNNHIMDAGKEGIQKTLVAASQNGVRTLGAGMNIEEASTPLYLEEAGGIGFIGVGYQRGCKPAGEEKAGCFDWSDMGRIAERICEIKKKARWCIVVAHGGEEFTALPSPYTRDRYLEYLSMGADFVVCHHPHVPMNYETVGTKMIFYSLGNFIFDTDYQRAQYHTEDGVLLKLNLSATGYSFEAKGLKINRENEHIEAAPLPAIFTEVPAEEYERLSPLAAKMFIAATKRQQIYLNRAEFEDASEEKWAQHFANPRRSGRVEGQGLDFFIICPLAEKEKEEAWKESRLERVKQYILEQM